MAIDETTVEFEACCCEQYNPPGPQPRCFKCQELLHWSDVKCPSCGYDPEQG